MSSRLHPVVLGAALAVLATPLGGCGETDHSDPESALIRARQAAAKAPTVGFKRIGRFQQPLAAVQAPGDSARLFVVEKTGRIRIVRRGRKLRRPFLSLRGRVSRKTEQGLLSLAFSPDYERSRRLYVSFTNRKGTLVVREYRRSRRSADRAVPSSARLVFRLRQPKPTHNGGHLAFGPDRLLYIGTGDGGGPGDPRRVAQDRGTLYGKILRIDPRATRRRRYRIPRSNPYRDVKGARDEIWAYGLRNPWRFSFDPATKDLWIGDVGQEAFEEVNLLRSGAGRRNFGWSAYEGNRRFNRRVRAPRVIPPVHTYRHGRNGCSITGGFVVRDEKLPRLQGRYLYSDFCNGELRSLRPPQPGRPARDVRRENVKLSAVSSFGEGLGGSIYVISLNGAVNRLVPR